MAAFVPAIHVFSVQQGKRTWMPGTSPGMTMRKKTAVGRIAHRSDCVEIYFRNRTLARLHALALDGEPELVRAAHRTGEVPVVHPNSSRHRDLSARSLVSPLYRVKRSAVPFHRYPTRTIRLAGPAILKRASLPVTVAIDWTMSGHYWILSLASPPTRAPHRA